MKNYWFSFSNKGRNAGVCLVQAESSDLAQAKMHNLGLIPEHDDVLGYELDNLDDEAKMEYNRIYSSQEMIELGYTPTAYPRD